MKEEKLKEFARFVRINYLKDFVDRYLGRLLKEQLPIMKLFSKHSDEELRAYNKVSTEKFLLSIENDTAYEDAIQNLKDWQSGFKEIPSDAISASELITIYSLQKEVLLEFLPAFLKENSDSIAILKQLDCYYNKIQEKGVSVLFDALKESEENYRDLFDNSNDLIHILSENAKILYVNTSWLNAMGMKIELVKGKSIYSFMDEENQKIYAEKREEVIRNEKNRNHFEFQLQTTFGKKLFLRGEISLKKLTNGIIHTRGIFKDLTEEISHKEEISKVSEEVNERRGQIEDLINSAPDAVIVINKESKIMRWNPKAEELFGWKSTEVIDQPLHDIIIPERYRKDHLRGMKHYLHTGKGPVLHKTVEVSALKRSGNEFPIALSIAPSHHKNERVFIGFIRDITEQTESRKEINEKNAQLERSNIELDQFASVASHDLQEPLRTINSYLELLQRRYGKHLDVTAQQFINYTVSAADRMRNLIISLLEYSRVNKAEKIITQVDLNVLIADVLNSLQQLILETKTVIKTPDLPTINGDKDQLFQLFQNLISNGIKFRKHGEAAKITISSSTQEQLYSFCVRDNGIGIEKQYANKIFELFQRLHNKDEYPGSGIGLAVCKKIVEKHGGEIWIDSEFGKGTTFCFTIKRDLEA